MYKVLLADDENSVRESLMLSVPWEELGLQVAGCAASGKEALEIAEREKIDIAILDIRMPGLGGLEVCSMLRQMREKIQLIIISGYAEFSYAERAMEFGVLGYCLKPLDYDKLRKLLLKAVQNLGKEEPEKPLPDLADAVENSDTQQLKKIFQTLQIDPEQIFVCVSVGEERCRFEGHGTLLPLGRRSFVYFTAAPIQKAEMERCIAGGMSGIGYEKSSVSVDRLKETLQLCRIRAYQFFMESHCTVCSHENPEATARVLSRISDEIRKENWEGVYRRLQELRGDSKEAYDVTLGVRLNNRIYASALFQDVEGDYYIYEFSQLVVEYGCFETMLLRLEEAVLHAGDVQNTKEYSNASFMKLLSWVGKNYKNDISLSGAAEEMHMNPNYVSRMFKKEAGVTFVHYITQLRMQEAARLLTTTNRPVVDIAIEVGFNDYFYFLKLFKKYMNRTPTQYREE